VFANTMVAGGGGMAGRGAPGSVLTFWVSFNKVSRFKFIAIVEATHHDFFFEKENRR
jgi:hypothetical protein